MFAFEGFKTLHKTLFVLGTGLKSQLLAGESQGQVQPAL